MVNKPSNAQRNLAVSFTTCAPQHAPQLLNYLRTSTLATYAATPTTPQHTPLLVHLNMHLNYLRTSTLATYAASHHPTTHPTTCAPNFAATYATSIQVLPNPQAGLHKLWYPGIRDMSTWSKFGAHGEHGDVFLFSNLGAL